MRLEVRINHVLAASDRPLDDLHAAEPAGPVALLAALERVQLGVCVAVERIGAEMREVIPLPERLDVRITQGYRLLCCVARVLVDLG